MKRNKMLDKLLASRPDLDRPSEERCSGRSTASALYYISWCLTNPNLDRVIYDHYGTDKSNESLMYMMEGIVDKLGLEFFLFRKAPDGRCIVRCELWRDE